MGGTGLGLSIAKEILEKNNSKINILCFFLFLSSSGILSSLYIITSTSSIIIIAAITNINLSEDFKVISSKKLSIFFTSSYFTSVEQQKPLKPTAPVQNDVSFGNNFSDENTFGNDEPEEDDEYSSENTNYEYDEVTEKTNTPQEDNDIDI